MISVGFWAPGFASLEAWRAGQADPTLLTPAARLLPSSTRRRTSLLTRAMAEVYAQVEPSPEHPTIFASAHGETGSLGFLLDQIGSGEPGLSPIRFSGSVHNAASGYISIATGSRGFTTSIAAGDNTVLAALWEAFAWLADRGGEVVVVVGDTPPESSLLLHDSFSAFAAAFKLTLDSPAVGAWIAQPQPSATRRRERGPEHNAHPCRGALDLLEALATGGPATLAPGWQTEVTLA